MICSHTMKNNTMEYGALVRQQPCCQLPKIRIRNIKGDFSTSAMYAAWTLSQTRSLWNTRSHTEYHRIWNVWPVPWTSGTIPLWLRMQDLTNFFAVSFVRRSFLCRIIWRDMWIRFTPRRNRTCALSVETVSVTSTVSTNTWKFTQTTDRTRAVCAIKRTNLEKTSKLTCSTTPMKRLTSVIIAERDFVVRNVYATIYSATRLNEIIVAVTVVKNFIQQMTHWSTKKFTAQRGSTDVPCVSLHSRLPLVVLSIWKLTQRNRVMSVQFVEKVFGRNGISKSTCVYTLESQCTNVKFVLILSRIDGDWSNI